MGFLWLLYSFFTPYVHPFERKAEKFFRWVNSYRSTLEIQERLTALMQENLLVLDLWLEKRFKNYRSLKKRNRRRMYRDANIIIKDFEAFCGTHPVNDEQVHAQASQFGLMLTANRVKELATLIQITRYLDPHGRYEYQESASFLRLLVNPHKARLIGDCNQIVTLYATLFARFHPVIHLRIKLLPGHVCLHYEGIDIEATSATFKKYDEKETGNITEIIATNILDISDPEETTASIAPETFIKAAQLSYSLSSKRKLVAHNLKVAYHNLTTAALRQKNLISAYFYAEKSGDSQLMRACFAHEFNMLSEKVKGAKLLREAKRFKDIYQKMLSLARKLEDQKLIESVEHVLQQINRAN